MKSSTFALTLSLFIVLAALMPAAAVHADMGPKPGIDFEIEYQITAATPTITEVELLQCKDANCISPSPLTKHLGPQNVSCKDNYHCTSLAYGYSEYQQLQLTFSDGKTRLSNTFQKKYFNAHYRVIVYDDRLEAIENGGTINPMIVGLAASFGIACIFILLNVGLVAILILSIIREGKGKFTSASSLWLLIATWIICLPLIGLGSFFSLSIAFTALLEGILALIYARVRRLDGFKLLSMVTLANTFTQLGMITIAASKADLNLIVLAFCELFILLFETVILYFSHRHTMNLKQVALLSLALNLLSFIAGLTVPF